MEWIKLSEQPPVVEKQELSEYASDNGKGFLVLHEDGYIDICAYWARAKKFSEDDIVYWMPLPPPPKED